MVLVVGGSCGRWDDVGLLAEVSLHARRRGVRLEVELEDEDLRALVGFAGLLEVLRGTGPMA